MTGQELYEELERIRNGNPVLRPAQVVAAAEDPQSPLHPYFTWDDAQAAHQYRLDQARNLIRVAVTILNPEKAAPIRAYVSLVEDRQTGDSYRPTVDVLTNYDQRHRLLQQARGDLEAFRTRYSTLEELSEVFAAMDHVFRDEKIAV